MGCVYQKMGSPNNKIQNESRQHRHNVVPNYSPNNNRRRSLDRQKPNEVDQDRAARQKYDEHRQRTPEQQRHQGPHQDTHNRGRFDERPQQQREFPNVPQRKRYNEPGVAEEKNSEDDDGFFNNDKPVETIIKGIPFEAIAKKFNQQPKVKDMEDVQDKNATFMIKHWKYNASDRDREPTPINDTYNDFGGEDHVLMPCSRYYISRKNEPIWKSICPWLEHLKSKCDDRSATVEDLKKTIENCRQHPLDMGCLERLISKSFSDEEYDNFMFKTLSKICDLALNVADVCTQPPPLLKRGSNRSVTMSQQQAASLLACSFFCLFPYRSEHDKIKSYEHYPNPNFERLYQGKNPQKIEKLKCIINYFRRVTQNMPTGVITFQRFALPQKSFPSWRESDKELGNLHLTTGRKIEEVDYTLQVDFANKYIGGGVLGSGCVQEEIRFSICPEMLVSLLVCEVMEDNECIFLIGCEQYSSYKGYAGSFQFDRNYIDKTIKDNWGRKWCYLVAMDAIYFREQSTQYQMQNIDRELLKAYTSFRPQGIEITDIAPITTGNWGCGAFNGDKQLKAIIQLMAASEAQRPLIYAAYGDKSLVNSFSEVYDYLKKQRATVGDLYNYLWQYSHGNHRYKLFDYILETSVPQLRSKL